MAKLTRATQKIFAKDATSTQVTAFGTAKLDSPTYTKDVSQIMNANFEDGWNSAILEDKAPYEEDDNGINYAMTRQLAYLYQEGIPEYDSATEYCSTSVVKAVEGGKVILYHSLADGNVGNALSDTTKWEEVQLGGNTRCIGEIVTSTIPLSDAGLHLLDGALISGTGAYADFVDYIAGIYNSSLNYFCTEAQWQASVSQYGVCGKFVYDSVNNTVRLPKVTGFIEGAGGVSTLGNLTAAGLPNITGTFCGAGTNANLATGAFYKAGTGVDVFNNNADPDMRVGLDASRSSSIYGNSTTVQPQSVKVFYYIVIATTTKTAIEVDIDEIATDLNGKADVDLTNVNDTGYIKMAGASMPSDTYVDLTLGADGSTYTAPADGWFVLRKDSNGQGQYCILSRSDSAIRQRADQSGGNKVEANLLIPVLNGQQIYVQYSFSGVTSMFRFIYAQGSESEAS